MTKFTARRTQASRRGPVLILTDQHLDTFTEQIDYITVWSSPTMDTRNPKGVTIALPSSWVEMGYLLKGDRWRGVGHRTSHSLDEIQQRKLLLHVSNL
ncbi:hypothetical protein EVAR_12543_1 [Eumeta japonica]|uniref:Uncharacterized protein n=1 Tax=Eumeta variegata TaxID=151549 RepID=A0A4C1TPQ1_EUMVA|nr:hypothetical protein EVAR_12543_1 [Eumeta japonica]